MTSKLTIATHLALAFILLGMGAHVLGFVTNFWCIGSRNEPSPETNIETEAKSDNLTDSNVLHVNIGLFRQNVEYVDGTIVEADSSLKLQEEQILVLSIAGANMLLCLVIYIRAIHIFVGVTSFIIMSLMLLSAFYTFEHTDDSIQKLQDYHTKWPTLALSWSFICVFVGLLVNIISTGAFLSVLLIKGERKASKSSKGLGPAHVVDANDKTPIVSTIAGDQSYENVAYTNEQNNSNVGNPDSAPESSSHPASESVYTVIDTDIVLEEEHKYDQIVDNAIAFSSYKSEYVPGEPCTDLDAVESDNEQTDNEEVNGKNIHINTVSESIRL